MSDPKNWASEFPKYADFQRWKSTDATVQVEWDLHGLNELLVGLNQAGFLMVEEMVKLAAEMLRRIAMRTPVRTGRARASWHLVPPNTEADSYLYQDDQGHSFDGAVSEGTGPLDALIATNVPYMIMLEAGHSRQAPNGMVAITLAEFQGALEARVDAILNGDVTPETFRG